jgi:CBS domain-containing protein
MSRRGVTVEWTDSIEAAARQMAAAGVHRVYAVDGPVPVGVVSTVDVIEAIRDAAPAESLRAIMREPVLTVQLDQPLDAVTDLLIDARVSGVIVADGDKPAGVFTQIEALAARDESARKSVGDAMDTGFICLPVATSIAKAAAAALAMGVRRLLAVEHRALRGIVSGLDFVRWSAGIGQPEVRRAPRTG